MPGIDPEAPLRHGEVAQHSVDRAEVGEETVQLEVRELRVFSLRSRPERRAGAETQIATQIHAAIRTPRT
jgi:hypothetical protein